MNKTLEDRVSDLEAQADDWKRKERNVVLEIRDRRLETLEARVGSLQNKRWINFACGVLGYIIASIIASFIF